MSIEQHFYSAMIALYAQGRSNVDSSCEGNGPLSVSRIARGDRPMAGGNFPLRAFFGHHKCATAWINRILTEICFHMGINFKIVHRPIHFRNHGTLGGFVLHHRVDLLSYTNANRDYINDLEVYRGFHVVRDPRDVVVSAYYSHLHSHPTDDWPELEEHRSELRHLSKEEGLIREMEFSRQNLEAMYNWDYNQEHILELRMEHVTSDPIPHFLQITRFLRLLKDEDLASSRKLLRAARLKMNRLNQKGRRLMPGNLPMFPLPRHMFHTIHTPMVREIVQKMSFSEMAGGRRRGQENVTSHYRKGIPGDWRNHFNEEHVRYFRREYGDLLIKLRYELKES